MIAISPGLELYVERGPDWLIVKIEGMDASESNPPLAEILWALMQQHLTHRIVLEMDQIPELTGFFISELLKLYKRINEHDGVMRICGLSAYNRRVLEESRLENRIQSFSDRKEAVMGCARPTQPR